MGRLAGWLLVALLLCGRAVAQDNVVLGDSWIYQTTFESLDPPDGRKQVSTERYVAAYLNTMGKPVLHLYSLKPRRSDTPLQHGGTTSDTCLLDIQAGKAIPGNVACDDPLPVGKSWYAKIDLELLEEWLTVTGREEVRVGPRSFLATVIRSDRTDLNDFDVGPDGVSARKKTRTTYWYVRELKGMARIVREQLDGAGRVRFHESSQLLEFTPAPAD